MTDCVFCRIVQGELPSTRVFEDDRVLAILDINPITPGHTLVLSKAHHETLTDAPLDVVQGLAAAAHRIAPAVVNGAGAEGFNLLQNNRRCAGQAVPHVHVHIIPRKEGDGAKFNWNPKKYGEGEMEKIQGQIKQALG